MVRKLGVSVSIIGLVATLIGLVFIYQGITKNNLLVTAMRAEKITLGIPSDKLSAGELIDSAKEAEIAGDTVREHRHTISPTYGDLLKGGKYDPTDVKQLTYAQALNLENYLYLAVLGFGLVQVVTAIGIFMILVGTALCATGLVMVRLSSE
jgi:hypothetical protein